MRSVKKTETCWLWTGQKWSNGYARFWYSRDWVASRFVYEHKIGPLNGHQACHHCDVPLCVRPDHLFAGTPKENVQDSIGKGRWMTDARKGLYAKRKKTNARLTPEQVLAIREEYKKFSHPGCRKSPYSTRAIALRYGVSAAAIQGVVSGRYWKYV